MGPELAAVVTLWGLIVELGPWFVVFGLLVWYEWAQSVGKLYRGREVTAAMDKAAKRETELVGEVDFWRSRYLEQKDQSREAIGVVGNLTTRGHR